MSALFSQRAAASDARAHLRPPKTLACSIPYAPFSKNDKLGRVVDWNAADASTSLAAGQGNRRPGQTGGGGKYGREPKEAFGAGSAGTFAYFHDEDEASFSLVDGSKTGAKRGGGAGLANLGRGGQFNRGGRGGARGAPAGRGGAAGYGRGGAQGGRQDYGRGGARGGRGGAQGGRFGWKDWNKEQRTRDASVVIGGDWAVLEEIEFSRLAKLRLDVDTLEPETLSVLLFRRTSRCELTFFLPRQLFPRIPLRVRKGVRPRQHQDREAAPDHRPHPLQPHHFRRPHYPTSACHAAWVSPGPRTDPCVLQFAAKDKAQIFATDAILSMLMCTTRSVYPWDIVLTREGDKLFMDKREGGPFGAFAPRLLGARLRADLAAPTRLPLCQRERVGPTAREREGHAQHPLGALARGHLHQPELCVPGRAREPGGPGRAREPEPVLLVGRDGAARELRVPLPQVRPLDHRGRGRADHCPYRGRFVRQEPGRERGGHLHHRQDAQRVRLALPGQRWRA